MSSKVIKDYQNKTQQIRAEAEARLDQAPQLTSLMEVQKTEALLHELQVYQIELKSQNEALRQAQAKLKNPRNRDVNLHEFAFVGHLTLTHDGLISTIDLTGAKILGLAREKLLQSPFSYFVPAEDSGRWHHIFLELIRGEPQQSFELTLKSADNAASHIRLDCLRIEKEGEPPTIQLTLMDIHERRQTDRRHIEAELRIAATVFESQEGMIVTDANGVILRVNRAFTKITGYAAEEALGKTPRLLSSGHHDADFYAKMWASINNTGAWEGEIWNRRKNGELYPEHLTITSVVDNHELVTNFVATLTDSTKAKQREQQRLADESSHRDTLVREVHHRC